MSMHPAALSLLALAAALPASARADYFLNTGPAGVVLNFSPGGGSVSLAAPSS